MLGKLLIWLLFKAGLNFYFNYVASGYHLALNHKEPSKCFMTFNLEEPSLCCSIISKRYMLLNNNNINTNIHRLSWSYPWDWRRTTESDWNWVVHVGGGEPSCPCCTFEVDCVERSGCSSICVYRKERVKSSVSTHGETLDLVADLITEDLISPVTQLIQQVLSFFFFSEN